MTDQLTATAIDNFDAKAGPPKTSLKDFWPHLRDHRFAIVIVAVVSLAATVLTVAQPLVVRGMIDAVGASEALGPWVAVLVGVTLGEALLRGLQSFALQRTGEAVILGLRKSLIARILRLPMHQYDHRPKGDFISRMGADTGVVRSIVTSGLFDFISAILMFLAAVVLMVMLDPFLFAITVGSVIVGAVGVTFVGKAIRVISQRTQEEVSAMTSLVERALASIRLIRASDATAHEEKRVGAAAARAYDAGVAMARLQATVQPLMSICIQGAFIVVLALGGIRVAGGQMSIGELMAFILYLFLLVMPVTQAMGAFTQIQAGLAAFDRIAEIIALPIEEDPAGIPLRHQHQTAGAPLLAFDNVSFGYSAAHPTLDDVTFRIAPGSRVAIVGPSGAGKSTLLALIERFYIPDSGAITYQGCNVRELGMSDYRNSIGYLEQNAPALGGTIGDNLRLGKRDATAAEMEAVLAQVQLTEVVARSALGLETQVGDSGGLLSGGERQRLSWARVLLGQQRVLLFDEPTSSVDSTTEKALLSALEGVSSERTLIVVAHRLSTVVASDQIIVLKDGRVDAIGTHGELLANSALYADLARNQLLT
ncbi:ABC transporter ATP-binding protein [Cryobacterium sp. N21]|uniref:ABC transporter ATP-binding protein n=1 Tax=Cryobacterium sp. N21 TaxID=2048289 RepID=UPI000CE4671D|nr:ABC transporter ATP-binding protein [Cryobacterium sp. N21]